MIRGRRIFFRKSDKRRRFPYESRKAYSLPVMLNDKRHDKRSSRTLHISTIFLCLRDFSCRHSSGSSSLVLRERERERFPELPGMVPYPHGVKGIQPRSGKDWTTTLGDWNGGVIYAWEPERVPRVRSVCVGQRLGACDNSTYKHLLSKRTKSLFLPT